MSIKTKLNDNWEFAKFYLGEGQKELDKGYESWSRINLPHDWQIFDSEDLYESAEGWYRRIIDWRPFGQERAVLYFEGVYMDATLFANGREVGEWKYGYTSFSFDITEYLREGENEILVRTVYRHPNSRWYSGAGIYRDVWLYRMPQCSLVRDGLYLSAARPVEEGPWELRVQAEICCPDKEYWRNLRKEELFLEITVWEEHAVSEKNFTARSCFPVPVCGETELSGSLTVENPALWSPEGPSLYRCRARLMQDGRELDSMQSTFGFRTFTFDPDGGFFVNGRHTKLNGVCLHHDLGALGAAFHIKALERQFRILREMGVNAIRTSHNPPSPKLLELADRTGMLVVDEAFDMWERPKTEYDYARFFREWSAKDVRSWVRRDRNHPCIVMWSVGNEISDTHFDAHGQELSRYLMEEVYRHDPMRNGRVTIGSNFMAWENGQKCADIVKLAGYNYAERLYAEHHRKHPDWLIYGSETSSTVQSRGIYHFPLRQSMLTDDDEQCSSLGNSTTSWGAKCIDEALCADRAQPFSLGHFLWSGFDYIGEPTPYKTRNSYFGMVDTAGFPKDAFYIVQSAWLDYHTRPMVHLYPYWDFNPGQEIDLRVCSNTPLTELFFRPEGGEERSLGRQAIDHLHGASLHADWRLVFEPGVLTAVAYDEKGRELARDVKRSFGDAVRFCLRADKKELAADGEDLIFLEISAEDENGVPVENANNRVSVKVTGAGMLIGLDNGDSTDTDSYKGTSRRLFSGKLLAIIAGRGGSGEICVAVTSPGMEPAEVSFRAFISESGVSPVNGFVENGALPGWAGLLPRNRPAGYGKSPDCSEIPVRKLELRAQGEWRLTPESGDLIVEAKRFPENATWCDLEWRAISEKGINADYVKIEKLDEQGLRVKITAVGDGSFLIRCGVKNGADRVRVLSQKEVCAEGFGAFAVTPFELVPGISYAECSGGLGTGVEKGVSTPYGRRVWMVYNNLDFGSFGSCEITLSIFEFHSEPLPLTFWDGEPGAEGSSVIGSGVYDKPSIWETYQEQTFRLDKRLRGRCSLGIELEGKANLKGFYFTRQEKAFSRISAAENDGLYGDSFTLEEDAVTGIGNNVSIIFRDLDFGEEGAESIILCGRTPLDRNTIQIRAEGEERSGTMELQFAYSEEYTEQSFVLERLSGKQTITFIFLPGCRFDFKWFRFERT